MELIFDVLTTIGKYIASVWADHTLAAAIITLIALSVFWNLMGWKTQPDFSDKAKVAKNGLIVLVGWGIAVPILDLVLLILSKMFSGLESTGAGIGWLWDRHNEQPVVVLICIGLAVVGYFVWSFFDKRWNIIIRASTVLLGLILAIAIIVPIVNGISGQDPAEEIVTNSEEGP